MRALLDLIFPPSCLACSSHAGVWLCEPCADSFPWIVEPCARCGAPSPSNPNGCARCRGKELPYGRARAAAVYSGPARATLLRFKLAGERRAARVLAGSMCGVIPAQPDVVTFVPSTRKVLAERGFNAAEQLARHVARSLKVPCRPLLRKIRDTEDQAGLSREARARNLQGAFAGRPAEGRVLLVDDIITTGATANECARALRAAGIGKIDVLTFARAL
jgi:ComF family protein